MISAKPNALVFVQRGGLMVAGKHVHQARLDFPPELVTNLELVNPTKFVEFCRQFFAGNNLQHKRVLMVLDNSLVFRKKIELDASGQPDALTEGFVAAMPFEQGTRACLAIQSKNLLQLLATNADLYNGIVAALEACGISKLVAIVPVAAYDLSGADRKISALAERFFQDTHAAKQINFASVQPV